MKKKVCLDERLPQESEFKEGYEKAREALLEKTGDASVLEGAIEIHHKMPLENLEAEEYMMPRDVLKEEMKKAGVDVAEGKPEKAPAKKDNEEEPQVTAVDTMMEGFAAEPELNPIEAVEAISYNASPAEVTEELKAAGLAPETPEEEKPEKPEAEAGETAVDTMMEGFTAEPELSPIEAVEAIGYNASPAEVTEEMKEAGLVPEKPEEEKAEAPKEETEAAEETGATGVDLMKDGFAEEPELTPIEEVDAIRHTASFDEVKDEMKEAGLMTEEPEK